MESDKIVKVYIHVALSGHAYASVSGGRIMEIRDIDRLVLMNERGQHIVCRLIKLYTGQRDQWMMIISQENVYYKLSVTQTEDGITELCYDSKTYRVSVITFRSRERTKSKLEYVAADSFEKALDLSQYIS
jgi:hypothetical protein